MTEPLITESLSNQDTGVVTPSPSDQVTLIPGGVEVLRGAFFSDAEFTMSFIQDGETCGTLRYDHEAKEFTFEGNLDEAAEILFMLVIQQLKVQGWAPSTAKEPGGDGNLSAEATLGEVEGGWSSADVPVEGNF